MNEEIVQLLAGLKNTEISDFRVMNRPSVGALNTMKAVLILFGYAEVDANWESGKKLMVNPKSFK